MQELCAFRDHAPKAVAPPAMGKYEDENDIISDIDHVDDVVY